MTNFETPRLLLCPLTPEDSGFIYELLNSPLWIQHIGDRGIRNEEDAENHIRNTYIKSYEQDGFGLMCVRLKKGNIPIGICGLIKRDNLADVDIGFAFLTDYIGKGYGYESAIAIIDYAIKTLRLKRLLAITTAENICSINLIKKLGMTFEKKIFIKDETEELLLFALTL